VKKVFLLAVSFFVFSCGESEKAPEWLLTEAEMVDLIIDFRLAEGRVVNLNINMDSAEMVFKVLERKVFEEHQVDSTIYKNSYQYYILHPERATIIFDAVLDSLNIIQKRAVANN
jgi:hypothetical protein